VIAAVARSVVMGTCVITGEEGGATMVFVTLGEEVGVGFVFEDGEGTSG